MVIARSVREAGGMATAPQGSLLHNRRPLRGVLVTGVAITRSTIRLFVREGVLTPRLSRDRAIVLTVQTCSAVGKTTRSGLVKRRSRGARIATQGGR